MTQSPPPPSPVVRPQASARAALVALSLCTLLPSAGSSMASVAAPDIAAAFGASFQAVQWVILAYLLGVTTLIVSVGRLGDLAGRRRLLLVGLTVFSATSLAAGLSPSLWVVIAARAAQGLGAAIMLALALTFASEVAPKGRTGSVMGLIGAMSATGTALGPSLGGLLTAGLGWRAIFLAPALMTAPTLYLVWRALPAAPRSQTAAPVRLDIAGTGLLALTLGAYAMAMTLGHGAFKAANLILLGVAGLGAGLFLRVEARASAPLIRLSLLRDPAIRTGLTTSLLVSTVMMATLVVGPFYLSRGFGLDPALVGLVMSAGPLTAALAGMPAGRLVDRFGARGMTACGLSGMALGALALSLMPLGAGLAGYLAPIILLTGGYALFQAANNTGVMTAAGGEQRGLVSGLLNLSRNLGLVTGASAMGAVFAAASGAARIIEATPQGVAQGARISFAVAAVLILLAIAAWAREGRPPQSGQRLRRRGGSVATPA